MITAEIEKIMAGYVRTYKGFEIVLKRDFGERGFHLIDGMPCMFGYVVIYGDGMEYKGCNAIPGAGWFQTVQECKVAIDILIAVGGETKGGQEFHRQWSVYREWCKQWTP